MTSSVNGDPARISVNFDVNVDEAEVPPDGEMTVRVPSAQPTLSAASPSKSDGLESSAPSSSGINKLARNNHNNNNRIGGSSRHNQQPEGCWDAVNKRKTWFLRSIFILSMLLAAVICAIVAYQVISGLEGDLGDQTYESVATMALMGAQAITRRKLQGAQLMAQIMSHAFRDAEAWPFIALEGTIDTSMRTCARMVYFERDLIDNLLCLFIFFHPFVLFVSQDLLKYRLSLPT